MAKPKKRRPKGLGSIRARGGKFQAIYKDPTGRQHAASFEDRAEAQRWIVNEAPGVAAGDSKVTLGEYLGRWLRSRSITELRPTTQEWYTRAVETHIVSALGGRRLDQVTPAVIDRFLADKERAGMSKTASRWLFTTLRRALGEAHRAGYVTSNPMANSNVTRPRIEAPDLSQKIWTGEQLDGFLASVADDPLLALWTLLARTGLRRGEALGLRWRDVDLDRRRLTVEQTIVMVKGHPELSQPKTRLGRRTVVLDALTVAELRAHRERQGAGNLVFTGADGSPIRPDFVTAKFRKLAARAGLPLISVHGLRHSHAVAMLASGVHPKIAQERLGHHSAAFTLDRYGAAGETLQAQAIERMYGPA